LWWGWIEVRDAYQLSLGYYGDVDYTAICPPPQQGLPQETLHPEASFSKLPNALIPTKTTELLFR
jgi:hypothetical protein